MSGARPKSHPTTKWSRASEKFCNRREGARIYRSWKSPGSSSRKAAASVFAHSRASGYTLATGSSAAPPHLACSSAQKASLESGVRGLREEVQAEESRAHYLKTMIQILQVQQSKIKAERLAAVRDAEHAAGLGRGALQRLSLIHI